MAAVLMRGVPIDTARQLVWLGVHAALNAVRDMTTDREAIVNAQMLGLMRQEEAARAEKKRAAHERHKAKDPDAYRAKNLEAVKRSRQRKKSEPADTADEPGAPATVR